MAKKRFELTTTQLSVMRIVELNANATAASIAKELGIRPHTVRHALDTLLQRGILRRYVYLNVYPLGFVEVDIFLRFRLWSAEESERVIAWCLKHDKVNYLTEIEGAYHIKIGLTVRHILEAHEFIQSINRQFGSPFAAKQLAVIVQLSEFGAHKSPVRGRDPQMLRFGVSEKRHALSDHDHDILKLLSREPDLALSGVARRLGIPASTAQYRIGRLEQSGVIAGYRYIFDVDGQLYHAFHAKISFGGVTPENRAAIHKFSTHQPNILFYVEMLGDFDFLLCMLTERPHDSILMTRRIREALGSALQSIEVYPVLLLRKLQKYPFDTHPGRAASV